MEEYTGIALRISISYLYVLALLRLSGRRSIGDLSPFDLLIALVVGDMFDDLIWGEIPLGIWLVGLSTIMLLDMLVSYGTYRSKLLRRIIDTDRTVLVRQGRLDRQGMAGERITEQTVYAELRLQGVDEIEEVKEAALESDGKVSVLKKDEYKPAEKRDLPRLRRVA